MKTIVMSLFIVCLLGMANAQTGGATNSFGATDSHDYDSIDLATLVPTIAVPVIPTSSIHLTMTAAQDCVIAGISPNTYIDCSASARFNPFVPGLFGSLVSTSSTSVSCNGSTATQYSNFYLYASDGHTAHPLPSTFKFSPCINSGSAYTTDGSGIFVSLPGGYPPTQNGSVLAANGHAGILQVTGTGFDVLNDTDTFGNATTVTNNVSCPPTEFCNGTFTDTYGAHIPVFLSPLSSTTTSYVQWTDTQGATQQLQFIAGPLTSAGHFNIYPVSQILYPDGVSTTLSTEVGTGRVASFTLRTGGSVSYSYPSPSAYTSLSGMNGTLTRTTPDGTTTYTASTAGNVTTTTVLDPGKNKAVYYLYVSLNKNAPKLSLLLGKDTYQNVGTVASLVYSLLASLTICYNNVLTNCRAGTASHLPISQTDTYEYIGASSTAMNHATTTYDTFGNVLSSSKFDYITGQTLTTTTSYGTWTGSLPCAAVGSGINNHPCDVVTSDGTNTLSETRFTYTTKGFLTSTSLWTGSSWLTTNYAPNANGTVASATDPNGHRTDFGYAATGSGGCAGLLPTSTSTTVNGIVIQSSQTWDCNGGVVLTTTDANGNTPPARQYDTMFRPTLVTDNSGYQVSTTYTRNSVSTTASFGSSVQNHTLYLDALGRSIISQTQQGPTSSNYDTVSTRYSFNGPNWQTQSSTPCVKTSDQPCSIYGTSIVDPLGRSISSTDALAGTLNYTYNQNDASATRAPAPAGEHVKTVQTETDGLGRPKSICSLETSGGAACGQVMGGSGILNTYSYSFGTGTSTVSSTRGSQTHTSTADALGRVTSSSTPEAGTTTYIYDTASVTCGSGVAYGRLVETIDNAGTHMCFGVDALGRTFQAHTPTYAFGCRSWVYGDQSTLAVQNGVSRIVEAYTDSDCSGTSKVTDEQFSYDKDGRLTDVWESTPHSGGYYHTSVTYNSNGTVSSISGIPSYTSKYTFGVDGEGRPNTASLGSTVVINGVTYDAASRPLSVLIGTSGDNDSFTYDAVEHTKTYVFSVNGKTDSGTLTWNTNNTLQKLVINDGFNVGGSQTCTYLYDDLGRLGVPPNSPPPPPTPTTYSVDCGSSLWRQVFSYDQYDNLTKTGNPGTSWNPGYNSANNRYLGSSYDSDGHLTYDGTNTYSWDAYGKMVGVRVGATAAVCGTSGSCATYDALGRIVETSTNATYKEYLFGPTGRLAQMSGTTVTEVDLRLPGGPMLKATGANGGGSKTIMHNDWLGTNRLATVLGNRALSYDTAYAPYGESYDTFGTLKQDFTGDLQDIFAGLFDTPNRELATNASRWLSPDPAGQGWNLYAYATDPNSLIDPSGLSFIGTAGISSSQSIDGVWTPFDFFRLDGMPQLRTTVGADSDSDSAPPSSSVGAKTDCAGIGCSNDPDNPMALPPRTDDVKAENAFAFQAGGWPGLLGTKMGRFERSVYDAIENAFNRQVMEGPCYCGGIDDVDARSLLLLIKSGNDFDAFPAGQGFTGVYDAESGKVALVPSTTGDVPQGWVSRRGGHQAVSEALGGDAGNHYGFAAIRQADGSLQLTWRSGVLNGAYPNAEVPMNIRPAITGALEGLTELTILP